MNLISVKFLKFILLTHPLIVFCEGCQKFSSTSLPWLDCGLLPRGFNDQDGTDYYNYDEDDDQGVSCDKLIKKKKKVKSKQSFHMIQKQWTLKQNKDDNLKLPAIRFPLLARISRILHRWHFGVGGLNAVLFELLSNQTGVV